MYELQNNALYDEVHAIMMKELLTFFKKSVQDIESEVPYNYYGNRGSVDLVWYATIDRINLQILRMFELESRIPRLEELIRKLKDRMEYFPPYFEQTRGLPKLGSVELFLVLLGTEENWRVVNEYLVNFKSAFTRTHQVFPKDILSKTTDPGDDEFYSQIKKTFLVFLDPLKVRQTDTNEDIVIEKEALPFHRMAAFQYLESWGEPVTQLQARLDSIKPGFPNARQFIKAYKEYMRS